MIKTLILDVDGTLTDGTVYFGENGEAYKGFYVRDGIGIQKIMKVGIVPVIVTSRDSRIAESRARDLGIDEVYIGVEDKKTFLEDYFKKRNINKNEIAYIADDINDLEAMRLARYRGCPADAVIEMRNVCNFVSNYRGGYGAVREFCEFILQI